MEFTGPSSKGNLNRTSLAILVRIAKSPGWPPSILELAEACGVCENAVKCHLKRLRQMRLVEWTEGRKRSIILKCRLIPVEELTNDGTGVS